MTIEKRAQQIITLIKCINKMALALFCYLLKHYIYSFTLSINYLLL